MENQPLTHTPSPCYVIPGLHENNISHQTLQFLDPASLHAMSCTSISAHNASHFVVVSKIQTNINDFIKHINIILLEDNRLETMNVSYKQRLPDTANIYGDSLTFQDKILKILTELPLRDFFDIITNFKTSSQFILRLMCQAEAMVFLESPDPEIKTVGKSISKGLTSCIGDNTKTELERLQSAQFLNLFASRLIPILTDIPQLSQVRSLADMRLLISLKVIQLCVKFLPIFDRNKNASQLNNLTRYSLTMQNIHLFPFGDLKASAQQTLLTHMRQQDPELYNLIAFNALIMLRNLTLIAHQMLNPTNN